MKLIKRNCNEEGITDTCIGSIGIIIVALTILFMK